MSRCFFTLSLRRGANGHLLIFRKLEETSKRAALTPTRICPSGRRPSEAGKGARWVSQASGDSEFKRRDQFRLHTTSVDSFHLLRSDICFQLASMYTTTYEKTARYRRMLSTHTNSDHEATRTTPPSTTQARGAARPERGPRARARSRRRAWRRRRRCRLPLRIGGGMRWGSSIGLVVSWRWEMMLLLLMMMLRRRWS